MSQSSQAALTPLVLPVRCYDGCEVAPSHLWFVGLTQGLPGLKSILAFHVHQDLESSAIHALGEQVEEHGGQLLRGVAHVDHGQLAVACCILGGLQMHIASCHEDPSGPILTFSLSALSFPMALVSIKRGPGTG